MKFTQYDYENIEDYLRHLEKEYDFKFENNELENVSNIDELVGLAVAKVKLENVDSCTKQQAFYKLRKAIAETKNIDKKQILLNTKISDIYSEKTLYRDIKELEKSIGFNLGIIEPSKVLLYVFYGTLAISLLLLFLAFKTGVAVLVLSIIFLKLSYKFSKQLNVKTIRELTIKISNENYLKVRSQKNSVNKNELAEVFWHELSYYLNSEKAELQKVEFKNDPSIKIRDKDILVLLLIAVEPGVRGIHRLNLILDRASFPFEVGLSLKKLLDLEYISVEKHYDDTNRSPVKYVPTEKGAKYLDAQLNEEKMIQYVKSMDNPDFLLELTTAILKKKRAEDLK